MSIDTMFFTSLMVTIKKKTYNRDTRNKEKGIKAYHYRKSLVHKEREQMRNKETRELQNNQKTMNNKALVSLHL